MFSSRRMPLSFCIDIVKISICRSIDRQRRSRAACMLARSLRWTLIAGFCERMWRPAVRAHSSVTLRKGGQHARHGRTQAAQGDDPFSGWIAANPLPGSDAEPQQVQEPALSAHNASRLITRRYHYTGAPGVVRTLRQRYASVHSWPDRKAFLLSETSPPASTAQETATSEPDVLPPQAQPSVSLKLPVVLQNYGSLSGTDGTALLQRVATGECKPGRVLVALLTADSAALALWEVCKRISVVWPIPHDM